MDDAVNQPAKMVEEFLFSDFIVLGHAVYYPINSKRFQDEIKEVTILPSSGYWSFVASNFLANDVFEVILELLCLAKFAYKRSSNLLPVFIYSHEN